MSENQEITGRIEGWAWDPRYPIIWGNLYDDTRRRWREGQYMHTSAIDGQQDVKEGDIVHTLNSRYLLGKPLFAEVE